MVIIRQFRANAAFDFFSFCLFFTDSKVRFYRIGRDKDRLRISFSEIQIILFSIFVSSKIIANAILNKTYTIKS